MEEEKEILEEAVEETSGKKAILEEAVDRLNDSVYRIGVATQKYFASMYYSAAEDCKSVALEYSEEARSEYVNATAELREAEKAVNDLLAAE